MRTVLALDMSTKSSGYALMDENDNIITSGLIKSTSTDMLKRVLIMRDAVKELYEKHQPTTVIMEDILPEDVKNIKTSKALSYLQAAIVILFYEMKKTLLFTVNSHWRKICGIKTGRGIKREELKQEDINFVKEKYNMDVTDDEADAICIAYSFNHNYDTVIGEKIA